MTTLTVHWPDKDRASHSFSTIVRPWCLKHWDDGVGLTVELRRFEDAKTDRQRAYYHGVVLKTIAQQARGADGKAFPIPVWKEYFRQQFLGHKTVTTINPLTGKKSRRRQRISTEDLGVRGYSDLIDRVTAFAAVELGVAMPMPFDAWEGLPVDPDTGEIMGAPA